MDVGEAEQVRRVGSWLLDWGTQMGPRRKGGVGVIVNGYMYLARRLEAQVRSAKKDGWCHSMQSMGDVLGSSQRTEELW